MNKNLPVDVTVVSPAALGPLLQSGLDATAHIDSLEDTIGPFFGFVAKKLDSLDVMDKVPLQLRALLGLIAIVDERERFLAEGLLIDVGENSMMTPELVAGLAQVPYKVRILDGGRMDPTYDPHEIVRLGKKSAVDAHRNRGLRSPDKLLADMELGSMGSMVDDNLGRLKPNKTLGESIADAYDGPTWKPSEEDFPNDARVRAYRDRQLSALTAAERRVFDAPRRADDDLAVRVVSAQMEMMPDDMKPVLAAILGAGPWSFYPLLDEKPDWSYRAYRDVVLSSPLAASVPCRNGCYPAYYVARHGSVEEFAEVLFLYPPAASALDLAGRPLLVDLSQLKNQAVERIVLALEAGADPNVAMPTGISPFTVCLRRRNFEAAAVLASAGYRPRDDRSLDQASVDEALRHKELGGPLRIWLSEVRKDLPPVSPEGQLTAAAVNAHDSLRASGMYPPRRKEH